MTKEKKHGAPPGELIYTGEKREERIRISMFEYNEAEFFEQEYLDFSDCLQDIKPNMVKWINFDGVHKTELIEKIGKTFKIHSLTLEDIVHVDQRPKFEEYNEYVAIVMRMLYYEEEVKSEQLSILLFDNLVISFQEPRGGDAFDIIRNRIRQAKGRVRRMGADYLAYVLMDSVVDHYFKVIDKVGEKIEMLDDEIGLNPTAKNLTLLHQLKGEVLYLRRQINPARDLISSVMKSENELFNEATSIFFRDVNDHVLRTIESVENYRETLSGIMEVYHSNNTHKMNEVMKTLTVITSIFIPVTFIVGVYGMNFKYMPEIDMPYAYGATWAFMIIIMGGMALYFKKRKWW